MPNTSPSNCVSVLRVPRQFFIAPAGAYAELRTAASILATSAYVLATQLIKQHYLNSFGLPMASFGTACVLTMTDAIQTLLAPHPQTKSPSQEHLNKVEEGEASTAAATTDTEEILTPNPKPASSLVVLAAAAKLCGSFGFFTHWCLARIENSKTPAMHVMVPITFGSSAVFTLIMASQGLSQQAAKRCKPILLLGLLLGAALFQHSALRRLKDRVLFGFASGISLSLLPSAIGGVYDAIRRPPPQ